jgi:hypothetical protein
MPVGAAMAAQKCASPARNYSAAARSGALDAGGRTGVGGVQVQCHRDHVLNWHINHCDTFLV